MVFFCLYALYIYISPSPSLFCGGLAEVIKKLRGNPLFVRLAPSISKSTEKGGTVQHFLQVDKMIPHPTLIRTLVRRAGKHRSEKGSDLFSRFVLAPYFLNPVCENPVYDLAIGEWFREVLQPALPAAVGRDMVPGALPPANRRFLGLVYGLCELWFPGWEAARASAAPGSKRLER